MREEIDEVLGDRTTVTADDLESLHYTEQVNSPAELESLSCQSMWRVFHSTTALNSCLYMYINTVDSA